MSAEMRMIRCMCVLSRVDRLRNVTIRERVRVASLEERLRGTRLRWFEHIKRRSVNAPVRRCETISLSHIRRGRGRPKMSWNEVIRSDMKSTGVTEDMAKDRNLWRAKIKIAEHRQRFIVVGAVV